MGTLSVRVPGCQKLQMTALNPVMLYSCIHMATADVKGLIVGGDDEGLKHVHVARVFRTYTAVCACLCEEVYVYFCIVHNLSQPTRTAVCTVYSLLVQWCESMSTVNNGLLWNETRLADWTNKITWLGNTNSNICCLLFNWHQGSPEDIYPTRR